MLEFLKYLYYRKLFKKAFKSMDEERFLSAYNMFIYLKKEKGLDNYFIDLNIGRALLGMGKFNESREFFRKSFNKFNVNPVPLIGIGLSYIKEKKYMFAYKYLKKAVKIDPIHPNANYYLGISLVAMKRKNIALKYFEKVLAEKKEFLFARIALNIEQNLSIDIGTDLGEF